MKILNYTFGEALTAETVKGLMKEACGLEVAAEQIVQTSSDAANVFGIEGVTYWLSVVYQNVKVTKVETGTDKIIDVQHIEL